MPLFSSKGKPRPWGQAKIGIKTIAIHPSTNPTNKMNHDEQEAEILRLEKALTQPLRGEDADDMKYERELQARLDAILALRDVVVEQKKTIASLKSKQRKQKRKVMRLRKVISQTSASVDTEEAHSPQDAKKVSFGPSSHRTDDLNLSNLSTDSTGSITSNELNDMDEDFRDAIVQIKEQAEQFDAVIAADELHSTKSELDTIREELKERCQEIGELQRELQERDLQLSNVQLERDLIQAEALRTKLDLKKCVQRIASLTVFSATAPPQEPEEEPEVPSPPSVVEIPFEIRPEPEREDAGPNPRRVGLLGNKSRVPFRRRRKAKGARDSRGENEGTRSDLTGRDPEEPQRRCGNICFRNNVKQQHQRGPDTRPAFFPLDDIPSPVSIDRKAFASSIARPIIGADELDKNGPPRMSLANYSIMQANVFNEEKRQSLSAIRSINDSISDVQAFD